MSATKPLPPAPAKNVLGQTLAHLGQAIVAGHYGPQGVVPPESALCASLGVSRTVVREAVKSLVAKGLLTTGPKVGTRVTATGQWNWFDPDVLAWHTQAGLTPEFVREVQELRRVIEPAAVRLAAERASAADLAALEAAYAGMQQAIEQGGDYLAHDLAFHQGLLRASGNRLLVQMSQAFGAVLRTAFEISISRSGGPAQSLALHRAVLDALAARAPLKAERASLRLIDAARGDIDAVLASLGCLPCQDAPPMPLAEPLAAPLAGSSPPALPPRRRPRARA